MLIVADNLRITSLIVEQAIGDFNPEPLTKLISNCIAAGAKAVDINPGPLTRNPQEIIAFLVETVRSVCDLPILVDTVHPQAIETALSLLDGKAVINGFSLEPAKLQTILPIARRYNAQIIGYLLYPNGLVPPTAQEKMQVAVTLYQEFAKIGLAPEKLIIDPIAAPLIWQDGLFQNREILTVIQNLPELLGFPVKTIAGLSNLTCGNFPRSVKKTVEQAFVPMLALSGLDYVLMDVLHRETVNIVQTCNMLLKEDIFAL